jgi:glycogen(starch) synthase
MRLLTVGNMYPPHHLGGYELLWQQANRRARERGNAVEVLTTDHREHDVDPHTEEPGVHRELRWYWRDHAFPRIGLRERRALERHDHAVLARRIAAFEPDIVAWWAMGGLPMSLVDFVRERGIPAVFVVIDDWLIYGPKVDRRRGWRAGPLELGEPVLFCSEFTRDKAAAAGVTLADARVVSPGIDARFLTPAPEAAWDWRLAYVGRIDERKGIETAVAALAHLPRVASLTVVGSGDEAHAAALRGQASAIGVGDRLRFTGPVGHDELPDAYARADTVLFPVRWDEPWGLVPLEAMGVGRPVIATGRGGSGEYLVEGENALLFDAGDPHSLALAVGRLAADDGLRARLRAGGFATAAEHTATAWADAIAEACEAAAPVGSPA